MTHQFMYPMVVPVVRTAPPQPTTPAAPQRSQRELVERSLLRRPDGPRKGSDWLRAA